PSPLSLPDALPILAPALLQLLADDPRDRIDPAAGRDRDHDLDGLIRVVRRTVLSMGGGQHGGRGGNGGESSQHRRDPEVSFNLRIGQRHSRAPLPLNQWWDKLVCGLRSQWRSAPRAASSEPPP